MSTTANINSPFPLSERNRLTSLSSTAAVVMAADKLRAQGVNVIDLGVGEPDFPTPDHIKAAAKDALDQNFTKYTAASGIMPLRQAICDYHNSRFGSDYAPDQCCVVLGGKQGIFNAVLALINPGDEVLLENPCWVSFPEIVHFAEGKNVLIDTESTDFHLTAEMVRAAITPKSKLLIINSPSNPTGRVIDPVEFEKIVRVAVENDIWVISDECYLQLVYPPHKVNSAAQLPAELRSRVLIAGSLSKTYAMTGWRVGYLAAPLDFVEKLTEPRHTLSINTCTISQFAALAALTGPQEDFAAMYRAYDERRLYLMGALKAAGLSYGHPGGAFYIYTNISATGMAAPAFCEGLLRETGVMLFPGTMFGDDSTDYIRISYLQPLEKIKEAMGLINGFIARHGRRV